MDIVQKRDIMCWWTRPLSERWEMQPGYRLPRVRGVAERPRVPVVVYIIKGAYIAFE
jgi:hypothetical protein